MESTQTKTCSRCKKELSLDNFGLRKGTKDGLRYECKKCRKIEWKKYYQENKKKENNRKKTYRRHNVEKIKIYTKKYYQKNRAKIKTRKEEYKPRKNELKRQKLKNDPIYKLRYNMSKALWKSFKSLGISKNGTFNESVGYSNQELYNHLSQYIGKPCEDCKDVVLTIDTHHIDHIIPISVSKTKDDIIKLNQLDNLRLICPTCNMSKSDKINE